jgi:SAM-dependent methyltransferase
MASPPVGQLQVLNDLFRSALAEFRPPSLAVLGCCTGNGFEHISPAITRRIIGVDINPAYLEILTQRFAPRLPQLELVEGDCASPSFHIPPVSMIFAALVFEYVEVEPALHNIARCLLPGGTLVAALQLPGRDSPPVTPTPYTSLAALTPIMKLVDVVAFSKMCLRYELVQVKTQEVPLKHGKALFVGTYRKKGEL